MDKTALLWEDCDVSNPRGARFSGRSYLGWSSAPWRSKCIRDLSLSLPHLRHVSHPPGSSCTGLSTVLFMGELKRLFSISRSPLCHRKTYTGLKNLFLLHMHNFPSSLKEPSSVCAPKPVWGPQPGVGWWRS